MCIRDRQVTIGASKPLVLYAVPVNSYFSPANAEPNIKKMVDVKITNNLFFILFLSLFL